MSQDHTLELEPTVAPPAKKTDEFVGRLIDGKYRVDALIGEGGMGKVYRGTNTRTESPVAIKTLLPGLVRDESLVRRFEIEAKSASNLRHPNTIRIYDFGREGEMLFMIMELLDGYALEQLTGEGKPIDPRRVMHIFRQACASLAEAHEQNIVHRDLKPDNIFLNRVGSDAEFVKVLDFGVAKLQDKRYGNATLTQAGMIFGTPRYMSPEQARGGEIDGRSDIYALGVILYECLTGKVPFDGRDPIAILIQHVNEPPPPFATINPSLPPMPDLEAVTMCCLRKDADERYANVRALLEDLEVIDARLAGHNTGPRGSATLSLEEVGRSNNQPPVTARNAPAGRSTGDAFGSLGVGDEVRDPTMALGNRTINLEDHGPQSASGPPMGLIIGGIAAVVVVAAVALGAVLMSGPTETVESAESLAAAAAATAAATAEGTGATTAEGTGAPVVEEPVVPRVDYSLPLALGQERFRNALSAAATAATSAVVTITLHAPEGVEGATAKLGEAEAVPLPHDFVLVRRADSPAQLSFAVEAPGHRPATIELPMTTTTAPHVVALRRQTTGGGGSSTRPPNTTPGGLANPYGP